MQDKHLPGVGKPFYWSAHEVLARATDKFSIVAWDFMSHDGCLERIKWIVDEMKKFVTEVRIHEGVMSKAQITGGSGAMSSHNRKEHDLAVQRMAYNVCSKRIARYAAWAFHQTGQQTLVRKKLPDDEADSVVSFKTFVPACLKDQVGNRLYQVVTFRHPRTSRIELGLVYQLWRGAATRASTKVSSVPRRLRVAKGVTHELDVKLTARVRLVVLEKVETSLYTCSCLSPTVVFDPMRQHSGNPHDSNVQLQLNVRGSCVLNHRSPGSAAHCVSESIITVISLRVNHSLRCMTFDYPTCFSMLFPLHELVFLTSLVAP